MNNVKRLLRDKGHRVWKVQVDCTVLDTLKIMAEKNTGSVVVMDDEKLVGIFTERDFARKVGQHGIDAAKIPVGQFMSRDLVTVDPKDTVNLCMSLMTDKRIRHLPVVENGQLIGIISIGDVVKDMIGELQFMVTQLENYITGMR
jgi:CBS domain-containing protein